MAKVVFCLLEGRLTISRINLEFYGFNQQFLPSFNFFPLDLLRTEGTIKI